MKLTTSHMARSDGAVERVNRSIKGYLRSLLDPEQKNWVEILPTATYTYNTTYHSSIGMTPYRALFGFEGKCALDATVTDLYAQEGRYLEPKDRREQQSFTLAMCTEALLLAQERMVEYSKPDKGQLDRTIYEVGSEVLVHRNAVADPRSRLSRKFSYTPIWHGPYVIEELDLARDIAKIKFPEAIKAWPVISLMWLKPFEEDKFQRYLRPDADDNEELVVSRIARHVRTGRNKENWRFFVVWRDYSEAEGSWEPLRNLREPDGDVR